MKRIIYTCIIGFFLAGTALFFSMGIFSALNQQVHARAEESGQDYAVIVTSSPTNSAGDPYDPVDRSPERILFEGSRVAPKRVKMSHTGLLDKHSTTQTKVASPLEKSIQISKRSHTLQLLKNGEIVGTFMAGFGLNPINDKIQQGSFATPEGHFRVSKKLPHSQYYKALLLSYPTHPDTYNKRRKAKDLGVRVQDDPGGLIEIHGTPDGKTVSCSSEGCFITNWTHGCIALNDEDMDVVYSFGDVGTKVEIVW